MLTGVLHFINIRNSRDESYSGLSPAFGESIKKHLTPPTPPPPVCFSSPHCVCKPTAAVGFLLGSVTHNSQAAGDGDVDEEEEEEESGGGVKQGRARQDAPLYEAEVG